MNKPLSDITVVDVSSYVTAGFSTLMLANQGAEIIKIERPGTGDPNRESGPPFVEEESSYFMTVNYGKKSVAVNLKTEQGVEIVRDLVADADVFIENFRPGKADALGLGYDDLAPLNEELIYCAISAFGDTGPWSDRPGFDAIMQGRTGVMSVTGYPDQPPAKVGLPFTDVVTGMWASFGIMTALHRRDMTGNGEYIDLAMFDSIMPILTKQLGKAFEGQTPSRIGTRDPVIAPYQTYETAEGYLIVAAGTDALWQQFCTIIGREDLLEDDRFRTNADRVGHVDELEAELETTLHQRTAAEWESILVEDHDFPAGPVWTVDQALDSEQLAERDMVEHIDHTNLGSYPVMDHPLKYAHAAHGFDRHAPVLGEHTDEILHNLDYTDSDIEQMQKHGVIGGDQDV